MLAVRSPVTGEARRILPRRDRGERPASHHDVADPPGRMRDVPVVRLLEVCVKLRPLVWTTILHVVLNYCVTRGGRHERNAVRACDSAVTTETTVGRRFVLVAGGSDKANRSGVKVMCDRESRSLSTCLCFGPPRADQAVQPMERGPGGGVCGPALASLPATARSATFDSPSCWTLPRCCASSRWRSGLVQ